MTTKTNRRTTRTVAILGIVAGSALALGLAVSGYSAASTPAPTVEVVTPVVFETSNPDVFPVQPVVEIPATQLPTLAEPAADADPEPVVEAPSGAPAGTAVPFIASSDPNNANGGDYTDPGIFCANGSASGFPPVCD